MLSRSGWFVFVVALAFVLSLASVAVARVDYVDDALVSYAPYTPTDGTGRALGYWKAWEDYWKFAPYTEPYAGTTNIGPHVPEALMKQYAPYTEPYAGSTNIAPHVPESKPLTPRGHFPEK